MGKYSREDIIDGDGIVSIITPPKEVPVIYIDLLASRSGKVATLRLTDKEKALIEKYSENIPKLDAIDTNRLIELSSGGIGIEGLTTPELFELSELPYGAVKRRGFVKRISVRTRSEFKESNIIHTQVHYSVVDEYGGEVTPISINGLLIVPECVKTANYFLEATKYHGIHATRIERQLKSFEKEYEKVRRASP